MSFDLFTKHRVEKIVGDFIEARRPPHSERKKVDLHYKLEGQSVIIYESRVHWHNKDKKLESLIAKATFVKSQQVWKVYWFKYDQKWHIYQTLPEVPRIEDFLSVLQKDPQGCFWG